MGTAGMHRIQQMGKQLHREYRTADSRLSHLVLATEKLHARTPIHAVPRAITEVEEEVRPHFQVAE